MFRLLRRRTEWPSRHRLRAGARRIGAALGVLGGGIRKEIGRDEIVLVLALGLVGYGCWLTPWRPAAFIVPGAVLLWMAVPPRKSFIVSARPSETAARRAS